MITVYGKDNCTYCSRAVALLEAHYIPFMYKKLGNDFIKEDLLVLIPEVKTLPQIFIDDKHLGGYNNLMEYLTNISS